MSMLCSCSIRNFWKLGKYQLRDGEVVRVVVYSYLRYADKVVVIQVPPNVLCALVSQPMHRTLVLTQHTV